MYSLRSARRKPHVEEKCSTVEQKKLIIRSGQVISLPSFDRKSRQRDRRYARDVVGQSLVEWFHDSHKSPKRKRRIRRQSTSPTNKSHSTNRQTHYNSTLPLTPTRRSLTATRVTRRQAESLSSFPTRVITDHVTLSKHDSHKDSQSLVNIPQTFTISSAIEARQCFCYITMSYQSDKILSVDLHNSKRDEVTIYQEVSGGSSSVMFKGYLKAGDTFSFKSQRSINDRFQLIICVNDLVDSRLSACCELKYHDGCRIGEYGLFWIQNIEGVQPCRNCLKEVATSFRSHSPGSRRSASLASSTSSRLRLPIINANQTASEKKPKSTSLTGGAANGSKVFTACDVETNANEFRPVSTTPRSSTTLPTNRQSSSSSTSTNLKWSAQRSVERSPSASTISKKSEDVPVSSTSTPVPEKKVEKVDAPSPSSSKVKPTVALLPITSIESTSPLESPTLIQPRSTGDVENFCIVWHGISAENEITLLRQAVNFIHALDDTDVLDLFLTKCIHTKVIVLLSYEDAQGIVHQIHKVTCVYSIYLISTDKYEPSKWTKDYHKIVGIYQSIGSIRDHLLQTLPQISSTVSSSAIITTDSTTTDTPFTYTQLLKETMLCNDDESDLKEDLLEFCRQHYADNPDEMKKINNFEIEFIPQKAIWWYTRNCFITKILNRAFRTQEVDLLFKMRFIMQCLHTEIKSIAMNEQTTVYVLLEIPFADAMNLQKKINGLLLFSGYLPAMLQPPPFDFNDDSKQIYISFSIKLGRGYGARVKHLCASDSNIDVLINIDTIFRIRSMKKINEKHWNVDLESVSHEDQQFKQLTESLRTFVEAPVVLLQMSKLLLRTNHYAECDYLAELLFTDGSLREDPTLLASLAAVHHLLGNTDDEKDNPIAARKQFFKSLRAFQKFLPADHYLMSASYNNIGSMYFKENEYDEAITFHQKALECQLKSASPDTDAIATYSNNIGAVYFEQGKYLEALKHLQRAATILEKVSAFGKKSLNLCIIYQKIAACHWRMDKAKQALEYYNKTLVIQLASLPADDHQISVTYFNLSTAYARIGQLKEAMENAEESVNQLLKIYSPDHPEVKENQAQLEIIRQKQWLQQVLSS